VGAIILGKMHLRWCDRCNLPILEQATCGICKSRTREVKLTPPGDARPAFEPDMKRLRSIIDSQYGAGTGAIVIPEDHVVLLNKAPDIDRMDEVILNGEVVGTLRFSLMGGDKFLLRPSSAARIASRVTKRWIRVDAVAAQAIRTKKASALAVGVLECDPDIRAGMDVLVLDPDGHAVSVGTSKMSSDEMMRHERGTAIKTRWIVEPSAHTPCDGCSNWDQVIAANEEVMTRRVSESKQFIKKVVDENGLPVAVSYSGGKDSLATLLLVLETDIKPKLIFVDTGLEFRETIRNVEETAAEFGLELIVESAGDSFWKNLAHFGPPAKDFRWCCKTCKLGPATQLIKKNFPDGVLSFIGQRAYESQQRAEKSRIWRNPWTPNQLGASPIQKWTALHVWIYLMSRKANVNPLYRRGLERIGCFMCPATDLAELRLVRTISQDYAKWQRFLDDHAGRTGRPSQWLEYDLWRWKKIPKSVLDELGLPEGSVAALSDGIDSSSIEFRSTSGYNPCVEGVSMEGIFTQPLPMGRVANLMNIMGEVTTSPDGSIAEVKSVTIFREGPVMIKALDEEELARKGSQLKEVVFRAVNCAGCGICLGRCKNGALFLDGQVNIDPEKCDHCGSCLGPCPAVKFRDNELDI
jgi:phosphoadenosine phosphosulfate reductase